MINENDNFPCLSSIRCKERLSITLVVHKGPKDDDKLLHCENFLSNYIHNIFLKSVGLCIFSLLIYILFLIYKMLVFFLSFDYHSVNKMEVFHLYQYHCFTLFRTFERKHLVHVS